MKLPPRPLARCFFPNLSVSKGETHEQHPTNDGRKQRSGRRIRTVVAVAPSSIVFAYPEWAALVRTAFVVGFVGAEALIGLLPGVSTIVALTSPGISCARPSEPCTLPPPQKPGATPARHRLTIVVVCPVECGALFPPSSTPTHSTPTHNAHQYTCFASLLLLLIHQRCIALATRFRQSI